jgi:hypothetical protein
LKILKFLKFSVRFELSSVSEVFEVKEELHVPNIRRFDCIHEYNFYWIFRLLLLVICIIDPYCSALLTWFLLRPCTAAVLELTEKRSKPRTCRVPVNLWYEVRFKPVPVNLWYEVRFKPEPAIFPRGPMVQYQVWTAPDRLHHEQFVHHSKILAPFLCFNSKTYKLGLVDYDSIMVNKIHKPGVLEWDATKGTQYEL